MKTKQLSTLIMGCSEIEVYYKRPLFKNMVHIKSSQDAFDFMNKAIKRDKLDLKEFFWVILLTHANRVIGVSEIGSGALSGVIMNTKEIFQLTLRTNASAVIVVHNHPSGNLKPSESDKRYTNKLKELSNLMDVSLLDHLIITSEDYYSFSDNHLL